MTGFGLHQAAGILRFAGRQVVRQPQALLRGASGASRELLRVGLGKSEVAPDKGDKRFADPAWRENPVYRAVMQTYLYLGSGVDDVVDDLGVEGVNAERARFALVLVREALAPTNFLLGNPAALKRSIDTGGGSALRRDRPLRSDMTAPQPRHAVDGRAARVPSSAKTSRSTPGAVIHRTEVFELIQYRRSTATVRQVPLLIVPPQINKYYVARPRTRPEHGRIPGQAGHPGVHDLLAQPGRQAREMGFRHLRAGGPGRHGRRPRDDRVAGRER